MVCIQNIKNFMLGWEVSQIFNFGLGFFNFSVQWYKFFMGSDVGKGIKCARCDKEDIDKWKSQLYRRNIPTSVVDLVALVRICVQKG